MHFGNQIENTIAPHFQCLLMTKILKTPIHPSTSALDKTLNVRNPHKPQIPGDYGSQTPHFHCSAKNS